MVLDAVGLGIGTLGGGGGGGGIAEEDVGQYPWKQDLVIVD